MLIVSNSKNDASHGTARNMLYNKERTGADHETGSAVFPSIQAAVDAADAACKKALQCGETWSGETILISKGVYHERVTITTPGLTLLGEGATETIISYGLHGFMPSPDIGKLGTFRSYTMLIDADRVTLRDLGIENTAGAGPDIGQAIALYADGDELCFDRIALLGWQDTLFTGPLPPKEIEKNGFIGPKQFAPRRNGRQYYHDCHIEGDIDFIFGSATAYFDHCTIYQKDRRKLLRPADTGPVPRKTSCNGASLPGSTESSGKKRDSAADPHAVGEALSYATAASTPEGQAYGYVFDHCRFLSDCPDASCYLGRPWRNFARVAILRSWLGPQIHPAGFHNWEKTEAENLVRFFEYQNEGPGADRTQRVPFVRELSETEAEKYTREKVVPFAVKNEKV
ncbi:MAG: pectinesterase family protein [Lachnospiraceae bacterium]|nr:pectinesterase family protein [Lachnospiraceae bacterium]